MTMIFSLPKTTHTTPARFTSVRGALVLTAVMLLLSGCGSMNWLKSKFSRISSPAAEEQSLGAVLTAANVSAPEPAAAPAPASTPESTAAPALTAEPHLSAPAPQPVPEYSPVQDPTPAAPIPLPSTASAAPLPAPEPAFAAASPAIEPPPVMPLAAPKAVPSLPQAQSAPAAPAPAFARLGAARPATELAIGKYAVQVGVYLVKSAAGSARDHVERRLMAVGMADLDARIVERGGRHYVVVGAEDSEVGAAGLADLLRSALRRDVAVFRR